MTPPVPRPLTREEIAALRKRHQSRKRGERLAPAGNCQYGCGPWPCDTIRALDSLDAALAERDAYDHALHSLTPGGSEYAHDARACVTYVRRVQHDQHEAIKRFKTDRDRAVAEVAALREAVSRAHADLRDKYPMSYEVNGGARKAYSLLLNIINTPSTLASALLARHAAEVAVLVQALRDVTMSDHIRHSREHGLTIPPLESCPYPSCKKWLVIRSDLSAAATAYEERVRAEERERCIRELQIAYKTGHALLHLEQAIRDGAAIRGGKA